MNVPSLFYKFTLHYFIVEVSRTTCKRQVCQISQFSLHFCRTPLILPSSIFFSLLFSLPLPSSVSLELAVSYVFCNLRHTFRYIKQSILFYLSKNFIIPYDDIFPYILFSYVASRSRMVHVRLVPSRSRSSIGIPGNIGMFSDRAGGKREEGAPVGWKSLNNFCIGVKFIRIFSYIKIYSRESTQKTWKMRCVRCYFR